MPVPAHGLLCALQVNSFHQGPNLETKHCFSVIHLVAMHGMMGFVFARPEDDEAWEGRGSEKARMIGRLAFRLWDGGRQVLCPGSTVRQTTLSVVEWDVVPSHDTAVWVCGALSGVWWPENRGMMSYFSRAINRHRHPSTGGPHPRVNQSTINPSACHTNAPNTQTPSYNRPTLPDTDRGCPSGTHREGTK